jgi:hypothetical protein
MPSGADSVVFSEEDSRGRVVVKIEHLALGDYCVDGAVLIERKGFSHGSIRRSAQFSRCTREMMC